MHYVSAEGLTKSYGIKPLFRNISFNINEGDKIAIVARNGIGKSTLLKILAGKETPDEGKLWINKEVTVALFEQDPAFEEDKNAWDNIFMLDHPVMNVIKRYDEAGANQEDDKLMDLIVEMDELNAWDFESRVKEILEKLNISGLKGPVKNLSGGQRKRVALSRTLIAAGFEPKHTLLIMDEPTNHLDVEMVEWLESYLNFQSVTLLMVTHDRYFLDVVCNEIWELDRSDIYFYKGDYENYVERKAARIESELSSIDKARNLYRKELEWMRKQPKARTTKSRSRQDNFYEVEAKAKQKIEDVQLQLQIKMSRLGGKILELKKIYKSYGEKKILRGFDYNFSKGERIGIIGKNGVGKSTFLNIIQGIEQPDSGKINLGETVKFGYFSQSGLDVKKDMRVIEYVKTIAESFPLAKGGSLSASQFLELFLFPGDKQYTYLSALSGGEKKRLQLLTVLFSNPNFLILDEPTNDLDLPTLSVLEQFLADFQGCLLIVSHDRYFMDKLVDHLFVFEGNGIVKDFPGNYLHYRNWLKENEKQADKWEILENKKGKGESTDEIIVESFPSTKDKKPEKKKIGFKEKREFEMLEKEIAELDAEKQQLEESLSRVDLNYDQLNTITKRFEEIMRRIHDKENRWLELSEGM